MKNGKMEPGKPEQADLQSTPAIGDAGLKKRVEGQQKTGMEENTQGQEKSALRNNPQDRKKIGMEANTQGQEISGPGANTQGKEKSVLLDKPHGQEKSVLQDKPYGQEKSVLQDNPHSKENSVVQKNKNGGERSGELALIPSKKSSQNAGNLIPRQNKPADEKLYDRKPSTGKKEITQQQSSRPELKNNQPEKRITNFQENPTTASNKTPGKNEVIRTETEKAEDRKTQTGISNDTEISATGTVLNVESPEEIHASSILSSSAIPRSIAVTQSNYNSPSIPPQKISKTHNHFTWGIEAGLGRSGITSGKLDNLFYSPAADVSSYQAINVGNSFGGGQSPSQVRPGLAATVGLYMKLPLDNPLYFKAGLRYDLFTTSILVGTKMNQSFTLQSLSSRADKSIGSYYTSGKQTKYTNRYNFIDLPISFGIRFARNSGLPFAWELGIAPGILVASNALNYNQASSIYYQDNSLFRKTQMQVFTTVPVQFFNRNGYALEIVPAFNYTSSSLFKPELNEKKHLLSAGISLRARF